MYRHDGYRSGRTPAALPGALRTRWTATVARATAAPLAIDWQDDPFVRGLLTQPVVAGDTVLVAVPDEHRVTALSAANGVPRWSFLAGSRIDTPPTLVGDLCLFGAHDGRVYCLSLADGQVAWVFRAAPSDARIAAYGQLESPWPIAGGVLVDQGVAYFAAGRHPRSDGGLHVFALQARTGAVVWEHNLNDLALKSWYGMPLPTNGPAANPPVRRKVGLDFEPVDLFVKDGGQVAMSRWRFAPADGACQLELGSLDYDAAGLAVPRGLWGYGIRQTKPVEAKPPVVFSATRMFTGTTNELALLLAGETLVSANRQGELKMAAHRLTLPAVVVPDGLAAARGRLYAALANGQLVCLE